MLAAEGRTDHAVDSWAHRDGVFAAGSRTLAEETPVAFVYDGGTHAVLMATPDDLRDFALGFSLTEGIVEEPSELRGVDVVRHDDAIELRQWLQPGAGARLLRRRRRLVGPTGCGLCGVESLDDALRGARPVGDALRVRPSDILAALSALEERQALGRRTHAVHAAGLWRPDLGLRVLREDVGRHNALDKAAGAWAGLAAWGSPSMALLTSRLSIELVQKAAAMGVEILVGMSAPTALARRIAADANITLVGVARRDGFEIFSHPHRIAA